MGLSVDGLVRLLDGLESLDGHVLPSESDLSPAEIEVDLQVERAERVVEVEELFTLPQLTL